MDCTATTEPRQHAGIGSNRLGLSRLGAGLVQGLLLHLLYEAKDAHSWPATEPLIFIPLLLAALFVPLIYIAGLGALSRRQLLAWGLTSALIIALLGLYDAWRDIGQLALWPEYANGKAQAHIQPPSGPLVACLVAGFFIAHSLVMAGAREGRRIASYPSHFDIAWKLIVQILFSGMFIGMVWLVLTLGGELFQLVRLDFLKKLLRESWFAIPVTTTAFACALHLTDVRPAIVHGIRNLLLTMMSWGLPVMTLIVGGFLLSLPFTGLSPLWQTRHAASVLLSAAGVFVVLINAAWQDGASITSAAAVIRWSARAASLLLVPVTAIAAYALFLRVADYGWTSDRVIAAACVLVAACYALGYAWAAVQGAALDLLAKVNIAAAFLVLATMLCLLSPIADPARLSVLSQEALLRSGKIPADKFDFAYLRFEAARFGREALSRLEAGASGPNAALVRSRIASVRKAKNPWEWRSLAERPADIRPHLRVWPEGAKLPESFLRLEWSKWEERPSVDCLKKADETCDAFLMDVTGDGVPEIVLIGTTRYAGSAIFAQDQHENWKEIGSLPSVAGCTSIHDGIVAGDVRATTSDVKDLEIGNKRLRVRLDPSEDEYPCAKGKWEEKKPRR
jgi:hypothetical protein